MAEASPVFSIIIPTYHRIQDLCQCLDCLAPYFDQAAQLNHGISLELIVSDDARDPRLSALLEHRYPWCLYTAGPACGPAANRNHGAHQASGEWLVFTDDDCLPQPGWIEAFAQHTDQRDVLEGRTSAVGHRTHLDQECPINETGGYLWSCNFAVRRELFLQLGGFNEDFPSAAMEDVEFNQRINKAGLRRTFLPTAHVNHPWRRIKGRSFLTAHAQSVAAYVRLHPETATSYSLSAQLMSLFRDVKATFINCYDTRTVQGLPRMIAIRIFSRFSNWQAVRQLRLRHSADHTAI